MSKFAKHFKSLGFVKSTEIMVGGQQTKLKVMLSIGKMMILVERFRCC